MTNMEGFPKFLARILSTN